MSALDDAVEFARWTSRNCAAAAEGELADLRAQLAEKDARIERLERTLKNLLWPDDDSRAALEAKEA